MLGRYRIVRGQRQPDDPLPVGKREDTRTHTHHVLRPDPECVAQFLVDPENPERYHAFAQSYRALLATRFQTERSAFDRLAELAQAGDVYLGCSCPTRRQRDVHRCHTVLALHFMQEQFVDLDVRFPAATANP